MQSSFENVRRLGKTGEVQEFGEKQAGALNEYYKLLQKDFGGATGSNYDTGVLIKEVLDRRNKDVVKNIIKKQEASENLLEKKIFNLPDGNVKTTGVEFRSVIDDLSKTYKNNMELAGKELDKVTGLKTIKTDEIAKAIKKLSKKDKKLGSWGSYKKQWHEANPLINPEMKTKLTDLSKTVDTEFSNNIVTRKNGKKYVYINGGYEELTY